MRALLDTNIVIHRENKTVSNYSIGHLFRWLDKLKYTKLIHPHTISEISKYKDNETQKSMSVKLDAYEVIKTIKEPSKEFLAIISGNDKTENDKIDNYLLFEAYLGRVDLLITEDKKMRSKAEKLDIADKVISINQFICIATSMHPKLIDYKMLSVEKAYFGNVNLEAPFFDSFKRDYKEFGRWFIQKCDEEVYICKDENQLLGFLYLKVEDESELYSNIIPPFAKGKRLKVGTFKVESTGFRLGERFIKIIFDNALNYGVDEIYVTLFEEREELKALANLLERWGFYKHGIKRTDNGDESVLVKRMNVYSPSVSSKRNYPNIIYDKQKFILPILDIFHTTLLPDSKLNNENEINFLGKIPHRYALQKVYVSWAPERNINSGDLIIFYRMGPDGSTKKYTSVITTIGIVDEIVYNFSSKEEFLGHCQNRSVFSDDQLNSFWIKHRNSLMLLKFIYVKSLTKRLTLEYLWQEGIITPPNGPRPFMRLSNEKFNKILIDSQTEVKFCEDITNWK